MNSVIDNAIHSVKKKISIHPTKPNFVDTWRHSYDWTPIDAEGIGDALPHVVTSVWSPIVWKSDHREQAAFKSADYGALDCDGTYPLDQACKDWCDTNSLIITTKSDTPSSRRYRIIFPWASRITDVDLFVYNQSLLVDRYEFDAQCIDGARLYWPGKEVIQLVDDGLDQPVEALPEDYSRIDDRAINTLVKYRSMGEAGIFPTNISGWLRGQGVEGQRNTNCYLCGKYLTFWGMEEDQIIKLVSGSKLPLDSYKSLREAGNAVRSGIRKAKKIEEIQTNKS